MRVSSCNCHRSFICCSKPSPPKHRSPSPPKSEDGQDASSIPAPIAVALEGKSSDEKAVNEQTRAEEGKADVFLKSSLKKPAGSDSKEVEKGNVKWMDLLGKELVELREFEPRHRHGHVGHGMPHQQQRPIITSFQRSVLHLLPKINLGRLYLNILVDLMSDAYEIFESGEEDNVDENPACLCVIQ